MALFRRRRPLHEQLARAAGLDHALDGGVPRGLAAETPGWDGEQRGEAGIHGVPRPRRWDTVATAEVEGLRGDSVHFVASGEEGTLLVEEDEPDEGVRALAAAVEQGLQPPYRAEAVRRAERVWAVAGRRIEVVREPDVRGDEALLVLGPVGSTLTVDGATTLARAPALERVGADLGAERVVRARRLDGDLWEVEAAPL